MTQNKIQVTVLLLLVTTRLSVYAQDLVSDNTRPVKKIAGSPTASTFSYPQSLFVDSRNGNIWVADFDNNRVLRFDVASLTNVVHRTVALTAEEYELGQNYPNPFNPGTTIRFAVRNTGHARVTVYNVLGQEVATLFNDVAAANELYSLSLNATNLPGGIYFYVLRSANRNEMKKMCLLK